MVRTPLSRNPFHARLWLTPPPFRPTPLWPAAGQFSKSTLEHIRARPEVAYIEHDQVVTTQELPALPDFDAFAERADDVLAEASRVLSAPVQLETERGAPWGLARISHRNKLTLGTFQKYEYVPEGGEGVDAYVIDTGGSRCAA